MQRILLVDDTPSLLKLGTEIFLSGGYDVVTATNGVEAIQQLAQHDVDLVITDILMPEMDGYSLCFHIRNDERLKSIPIVIYSATYTSQSDEELGMTIGADLFIRKPATMASLLNSVRKLLVHNTKRPASTRTPELTDVMKQYNSRLIEKLEEKNQELLRANRLYSFISAINQNIVQIDNEQELLDKCCEIAVTIGGFRMAWIGLLNEENVEMVSVCGDPEATALIRKFPTWDMRSPIASDTPAGRALRTGTYAVSNDIQQDPVMTPWKSEFERLGIRSNIALPLHKSGMIVGLMGLSADIEHFFDAAEIALLEKIAADMSYGLDVFEKDKLARTMRDELVQNELRLVRAQSLAHVGSWELRFEQATALWSDEACKIYGFSPSDNRHTYETWLSFIHPDDLAYVLKMTDEGRKTLRSQAFHHRIIRLDGSIRHVFSEAHYEFNQDGNPIGLHGIVHDVTEMRAAEHALEQSQVNLRVIMDLVPQGIMAKDLRGRYLFANKSFAALYGATPEQLLNRTLLELIPDTSEASPFLEQDAEVIRSGQTLTIPETPFTDYTGKVRYVRIIKLPFTIADTREKAVLGITEDITEQKLAQEERNKIVADIMQRNVDLEQFSYIVSHNLRAPVANIIGLTDLITTMPAGSDNTAEIISWLADSAKKLDAVVRDLNHILQVRQGISYQWATIHLSVLLADIQASIDNLIRTEGVSIHSDFSAINEVQSIGSYMYSIFYNLITNSIKYHRPEVPPVIDISSSLQNGHVVLTFSDNGRGMDLEKIGPQIFGLYRRFHHDVEGKGMGLYMVKTQVETLGGTIEVSSNVNEGTIFRITLPRKH